MAIQQNIRQLAQEIFPGEGRSKGLAFAIGLFYGFIAANYVKAESNNTQEVYDQKVADLYVPDISEINSTIVFDVRLAVNVFQHTFLGLYETRVNPFSLKKEANSLNEAAFNFSNYFTSEENEVFNQYREPILNMCSKLNEIYTVQEQEEA